MSTASLELSDKGLLQARQFLRDLQAQTFVEASSSRSAPVASVLDAALARLNMRSNFQPTADPTLVKRGGITFDCKMEEKRIALAENLIRRVDPGPFEDPVYLELLAYQAAAIEMVLPPGALGKNMAPEASKFLLGTIHSSHLHAFAQKFNSHGYVIVALFSALIEFVYQAAKTLVALQHPVRSLDHRFSVSTDLSAEHIEARLQLDQEPVERLYRTLEACFYKGYPRAFQNESVPAEHVLPLTHLVGMAERWIMAHEYGHGLAVRFDWNHGPVENPARPEEYFADENATVLCALSAARLDRLPPYFAVIGGTFALACVDIFQRGLAVVRRGDEDGDLGDAAHPPNRVRARRIFDVYNTWFGVQTYLPGGAAAPATHEADRDPFDAEAAIAQGQQLVFRYPNALLKVWTHVRKRLLQDFQAKRAVHPMWP